MTYLILILNSGYEMVLIRVCATNCKVLWLSLIMECPHINPWKKYLGLSHKKVKKGVKNQPYYPAFRFVYILMHHRKEWVLAQLGSQHKRIEWQVWPVCPDNLQVSFDYESFNFNSAGAIQNKERQIFKHKFLFARVFQNVIKIAERKRSRKTKCFWSC